MRLGVEPEEVPQSLAATCGSSVRVRHQPGKGQIPPAELPCQELVYVCTEINCCNIVFTQLHVSVLRLEFTVDHE